MKKIHIIFSLLIFTFSCEDEQKPCPPYDGGGKMIVHINNSILMDFLFLIRV